MAPDTCPNCGADVPRSAKACPECGSCEKTGWSERAAYDGVGLPDDAFDYDEFVREEFGERKARPSAIKWIWWGVAVLVVMALLFLYFR
jgi:predicted nucleic acid-binding Zn ribbon protein